MEEEGDGKVRCLADVGEQVEVRKKGKCECEGFAREVVEEGLALVRKAECEVLVPDEQAPVSNTVNENR